ncbi:MAG: segregation/condensation protein A, partial [Clostridia bacterium]|nr:segregation/condensation protein A [Clostridia bacterium]
EEELIRQLTEYKRFKEISARMHQLEEEARALMTKLPEEYPLPPPNIEITGLTLEKLAKAFKKVLARAEQKEANENMASREIRRDSFTVAGCMAFIARRLRKGSCRFDELFGENYIREEVITMFLAILEMAKLNRLRIEQNSAYEEIFLCI